MPILLSIAALVIATAVAGVLSLQYVGASAPNPDSRRPDVEISLDWDPTYDSVFGPG